jgi:hypothetical protein
VDKTGLVGKVGYLPLKIKSGSGCRQDWGLAKPAAEDQA